MIRPVLRVLVLSTALVTSTLAVPKVVPLAPAIRTVSVDDVCLAWAIDSEARGESVLGQRAIYDVVENRMKYKRMTACQVVKEPYQFSAYRKGMQLKTDKLMLQRLAKVRKIPPAAKDAVGFHNNTVHPTWADRLRKVTTIGKHAFYAFRKPPKGE